MDSREAPLFVVAQGWRTVCYCPLERRGRHSANPYGFDAAGIARLGGMPRIAENEPIESCTASDAMA